MSPAKRPIKFATSLVAFIDMLGFSDKARRADSPEKLAALRDAVKKVRDQFEHRPKDPEIRRDHRWSRKQVIAFSDCLVVAANVDSLMSKVMGSFDAFGDELLGFAYAQTECVADGHFISGGIDLGPWYYRDQIMVSPAMVNAHQIQEKLWHPVLAVTDNMYNFFVNHPDRRQYSPDSDPTKWIFRELDDGQGNKIRFLDYLEHCLRSDLGWVANIEIKQAVDATEDPEEGSEIRERGRQIKRENFMKGHAASISNGFQTCPDRAKRKYKFLETYHNQVIDEWFSGKTELRVVL